MAFEKGHKQGKGRPKGSQNKSTLAKKEQLEQQFNDNGGFEALFESINKIDDDKDKAAILLKVMEFFMAKHKTIEHVGETVGGIAQVVFTQTGVLPVTSEKQMQDDNK